MAEKIRARPKLPNTSGSDPFVDDVLERKPTADLLTNFISRLDGPYVLAIDSPWGTGKTTFIAMWESALKSAGFNCVSFNAWKADFAGDPLAPLVSELSEQLRPIAANNPRAQKAIEIATHAAGVVLRRSIPIATKLLTAGALDLDAVSEAVLSDLGKDLSSDLIESYAKDRDAQKKLRTALSRAVEEVGKKSDSDCRPIVVFIDELDRCKPTFAMALLERLKHVFDVPGVVFVLAIDRVQLENCVGAIYGRRIDSRAYLRRFIDFEFKLPDPDMKKFISWLFDQLQLSDVVQSYASAPKYDRRRRDGDRSFFLELTADLCVLFRLSLREAIQLISRLSIVVRTIPHDKYFYPVHLALLCVLRECRPDIFAKLNVNSETFRDVLHEIVELPGGPSFMEGRSGMILEAALILGACESRGNTELIEELNKLSASADRSTPQKPRVSELIELIEILRRTNEDKGQRASFDRLAMATGFFSEDYD